MLRDQIQNEMKQAMKAKDAQSLSVIRVVWANVRKIEIDGQKELGDAELVSVIQKEIKSREETIGYLKKDNREDAILVEEAALNLLKKWLPEQIDEETVKKIIQEEIARIGNVSAKDMGKVMGVLLPKLKGKFDSARLSALVKGALNG